RRVTSSSHARCVRASRRSRCCSRAVRADRRRRAIGWRRSLCRRLGRTAPSPRPAAPAPPATEDWNDAQIAWQPLEPGLVAAARTKKPVCVVIFTTWCPHCKNYSKVFHDERVVAKSKGFVMVRIDKDRDAAGSARFAPDGEYIPRTVFLASNGTFDPDIHAARDSYKYFYPESDPTGILAGMD